jgi:hypothetical protein
MRSLLRSGLIVAMLVAALVATVAAQEAAPAAEAPMPSGSISGTMVGDRGGAYVTLEVALPADTDVTLKLEHWPCLTGGAVGVNVWTADGWLAQSEEADACTQEASFNTGAGGPASIQVFNYLHGIGTWYSLTAEGITLPGAMPAAPAEVAPAEEAAPVAEAEEAEEAVPAEEAAAAEPAEEAEEAAEMMPVAPAPAGKVMVEDATLFGNSGGAFASYDLAVMAGKEYEVTMTYGADLGGEWKAVGFNVWCASGWAAQGAKVDMDTKEATFTADADGTCQIQVYNYYEGLTVFYSLEGGEMMAE